MSLDQQWFSEIHPDAGSAFSLKITKTLHEEQTEYQNLAVYETEQFGRLMTLDGLVMLTQRDNFIYHEMMTHTALFSHNNPENIVIIGGGDCGTLQEVLKHQCVKSASQIEIDERVTRISEEYFPELCTKNNDPRAHFKFEDAIEWIKNVEAESVDIIIVDSTDPVGPAEGLFQQPFYKNCHQALRSGGLLIQQSESPLYHTQSIIKPMRDNIISAGFQTTQINLFPQCVYPSGWWSAMLACKDQTINFNRKAAADSRNFETQYYNSEIHASACVLPEFMRRQLA